MNKDKIRKVRQLVDEGCSSIGIIPAISKREALAILDAALAAEPQPVITDGMALAFIRATTDASIGQDDVDDIKAGLRAVFAIYTAPTPAPQREWQELSPLEMRDTLRNCAASTFDKLAPHWYEVKQFVNAIDAALKEKNNAA